MTATDNGEGLPATMSTTAESAWMLIDNAAPVITEGEILPVTCDEDNSPTTFALTLHATDGDGFSTPTRSIQTPASHGIATAGGTGTSKVISYTPAADWNGSGFVIEVADGNGGTDSITVNVTVSKVNDPPVNTVPLGQTVNEDTNLVFSAANGNLISTADIDVDETTPPNNTLQTTLTVGHGRLTLSRTRPDVHLRCERRASMTIRGTVSNINAALNGMTYRGDADYSGSDTLSITTSDLGNTGSGGALVDADGVSITVTNFNDLPVLANLGTMAYTENQTATPVSTTITLIYPDDTTMESANIVISENYVNGQDVLAFANTAMIVGTWVPSAGSDLDPRGWSDADPRRMARRSSFGDLLQQQRESVGQQPFGGLARERWRRIQRFYPEYHNGRARQPCAWCPPPK